jgi:hypothetical protein
MGAQNQKNQRKDHQIMERTGMTLRKTVKGEDVLAGLIRKAIEFRADEIEIERIMGSHLHMSLFS